jgi:hypothetical protein
MVQRHEYSPRWAPWVRGWYEDRVVDQETGEVEPAKVGATCSSCGQSFGPRLCDTGRVRKHICDFALAHLHSRSPPQGAPSSGA